MKAYLDRLFASSFVWKVCFWLYMAMALAWWGFAAPGVLSFCNGLIAVAAATGALVNLLRIEGSRDKEK